MRAVATAIIALMIVPQITMLLDTLANMEQCTTASVQTLGNTVCLAVDDTCAGRACWRHVGIDGVNHTNVSMDAVVKNIVAHFRVRHMIRRRDHLTIMNMNRDEFMGRCCPNLI